MKSAGDGELRVAAGGLEGSTPAQTLFNQQQMVKVFKRARRNPQRTRWCGKERSRMKSIFLCWRRAQRKVLREAVSPRSKWFLGEWHSKTTAGGAIRGCIDSSLCDSLCIRLSCLYILINKSYFLKEQSSRWGKEPQLCRCSHDWYVYSKYGLDYLRLYWSQTGEVTLLRFRKHDTRKSKP